MKYSINVFILIILISVSFFSSAKSDAKQKKIEVKCHVELYGGTNTLYFRTLKEKKFPSLATDLINKKVTIGSFKKKQKIYKVYQCVPLKEDFTNYQSQLIDKRIAR